MRVRVHRAGKEARTQLPGGGPCAPAASELSGRAAGAGGGALGWRGGEERGGGRRQEALQLFDRSRGSPKGRRTSLCREGSWSSRAAWSGGEGRPQPSARLPPPRVAAPAARAHHAAAPALLAAAAARGAAAAGARAEVLGAHGESPGPHGAEQVTLEAGCLLPPAGWAGGTRAGGCAVCAPLRARLPPAAKGARGGGGGAERRGGGVGESECAPPLRGVQGPTRPPDTRSGIAGAAPRSVQGGPTRDWVPRPLERAGPRALRVGAEQLEGLRALGPPCGPQGWGGASRRPCLCGVRKGGGRDKEGSLVTGVNGQSGREESPAPRGPLGPAVLPQGRAVRAAGARPAPGSLRLTAVCFPF